jgi:hypothetical protein
VNEEELLPALYEHCETVYEAMRRKAVHAEMPKAGVARSDSPVVLVYTGFLTELFKEQGLAVPMYTSVMDALKRMGCAAQLARGGGQRPSEWELCLRPTPELFRKYMGTKGDRKKRFDKYDTLEQQVRDQGARLALLTKQVDDILTLLTEENEEVAS